MSIDDKVEIENFPPTKSKEYKFVQINAKGMIYLVFPMKNKYDSYDDLHGTILWRFLEKHGLAFEKRDGITPEPEGENYKLIGAGHVSIYLPKDMTYYFKKWQKEFDGKGIIDFTKSDFSRSYQMEMNKEQLEKVKKHLEEWRMYIERKDIDTFYENFMQMIAPVR